MKFYQKVSKFEYYNHDSVLKVRGTLSIPLPPALQWTVGFKRVNQRAQAKGFAF